MEAPNKIYYLKNRFIYPSIWISYMLILFFAKIWMSIWFQLGVADLGKLINVQVLNCSNFWFQGIESDFESTLALANLTDGSKHDVDIIIYNRQLIGSFISDIGPSYKTSTAETVTTMPSTLPSDKQVQLVAAAYQCCTETGKTAF